MDATDVPYFDSCFYQALSVLKKGEAVIFPTETVYGLGISIKHAQGPEELFRLKERDRGKPISWLIGSPDDLGLYGENITPHIEALAHNFWPGSLTLVVKASKEVPRAFQSAEGTIGLRMPDNEIALKLIGQLGCPLATTSANISGQESSSSFAAIDSTLLKRVSGVLKDINDVADTQKSGTASTVLDCSVYPPRILREGVLSSKDFELFS